MRTIWNTELVINQKQDDIKALEIKQQQINRQSSSISGSVYKLSKRYNLLENVIANLLGLDQNFRTESDSTS